MKAKPKSYGGKNVAIVGEDITPYEYRDNKFPRMEQQIDIE